MSRLEAIALYYADLMAEIKDKMKRKRSEDSGENVRSALLDAELRTLEMSKYMITLHKEIRVLKDRVIELEAKENGK
jgi:hypothetical protein